MLHAASAYQERKVPYIGFLWASLLFRPDLSLDYAHVLLRLADRVSYRQLQVIAFLAENAGSEGLSRLQTKREEEGHWSFSNGLAVELAELGDLSLFGFRQEDGSVPRPAGTYGGGDPESLNLHVFALTPLGKDVYDLMELQRIPAEEKEHIFDLIRVEH